MSTFGAVRSLQRGLEILQAINCNNGLRAAEVAKIVSIPRPTAYRLLETLEGLGFVAFVAEQERMQILAGLRERIGADAVDFHEDGPLGYILDKTRELGIGFRIRGFNSRTMSISAPIYSAGRPIACLTMIWIGSALKFEEALRLHKDALVSAANAISSELARLAAEHNAE